MNESFTLLNATIFFFLGLIHFYWLAGGSWALDVAVPTNRNGKRIFKPRPMSTLIVAIGLFFFACVNLTFGGYIKSNSIVDFYSYAMGTISFIFFLRLIGDFRYIGIFKKHRYSAFSKRDTWIYIPLSFWLALSHVLLVLGTISYTY